MKRLLRLGVMAVLAVTFVAMPFRSAIAEEDEFAVKVHNSTKETIKKLLVSEDGEEYSSFNVGPKGIPPGETVTLKWDKSENDEDCDWFIKAVFADGSESEAKEFDFCEDDLELEF